MRVLVLGCGRVGGAIARDLARDAEFDVAVADVSHVSLARLAGVERLERLAADLGDEREVRRLASGAELVVGAVPGDMGYATLSAVLEAGRNVVDISFFPEDPFGLDELARERGLTAIVDCGVAPGCDNLILGFLQTRLSEITRFSCMVGGLPVDRRWPWEYKAPFSPIDVIAEYTRPARLRRGGALVTLPALTEPELIDFPGVGTLEAFNTDGLRSLLATTDVPDMVEKTLRYPGHIDKIRVLRDSGFFSTDAVRVGDATVRPLDLTARLLFPTWQLAEGEEDFTVMRVEVDGRLDGVAVRHTFDMLDRYDRATATTSMARTTGYTATAAVRMLARGLYRRRGVSPPELVGREPGCYEFMIADLAAHGVTLRERSERLGEEKTR